MAVSQENTEKKGIPHGLWTTCKKCEQIIFKKELDENFKVCPKCGYYFRLSSKDRIKMLAEPDTFEEVNHDLLPGDPLGFPDYAKKVKAYALNEAICTGRCMLGKFNVMLCVMDFEFLGGSMGSVVGEKIARACELAVKEQRPVIIVSSSGGARMHEGVLSLMQMAKTSASIAMLSENFIPYISVLSDPTTGGVTASFAMLGDVIVAEPKALIGFAGPRLIEQTIRQQLPEGFQLSEFLLSHGMLDLIVERKDMKTTLEKILLFFEVGKAPQSKSANEKN